MDYSDGINNQRKGIVGESIVLSLFLKKKYYVYTPAMDGVHEFDFLVMKRVHPKIKRYKSYLADAKTTSGCKGGYYYVNEKQLNKYFILAKQMKMPFLLMWVDLSKKVVMYNNIFKVKSKFIKEGDRYKINSSYLKKFGTFK
jgi:hypothetical protein